MRFWLSLFLLTFAPSATAATEGCRLCAPREREQDARAIGGMSVEVQTSLDFDRVLLTGEAGGTARLGPDGSRSSSGSVGPVSGRVMVGSVLIRGEPNRQIRVDLPNRIELVALNGARVTLERVVSDLGPYPRLDASGRLTVRFGGELRVTGTAEGDYRGDVPITVDYL